MLPDLPHSKRLADIPETPAAGISLMCGGDSHKKGHKCWAGDCGLTWVVNGEPWEVLEQRAGFLSWILRGSTVENGVGGGDRVQITEPASEEGGRRVRGSLPHRSGWELQV